KTHIDPADYPVDGGDKEEEEEESSGDDADNEDEEEASKEGNDDEEGEVAPADSSDVPIDDPTPMTADTEALIVAIAVALPSSSPPPSPLTPLSSSLPQILSPPLPLPSPSLPLPAPSSPLLLPATDLLVDTVDVTLGRLMSREVSYGITDVWDDMVRDMEERAPTTLEELSQRVTDLAATLARDTHEMRYHLYTAKLLESEARYARQAWSQAMDCNKAVHAELLAYRVEVRALHEQIGILQRQIQ
ncbi:hypothetical protein Tco_1007544, partial [Tanacetum coccineum]